MAQRIAVILIAIMGAYGGIVSAGQVHIYHGDFNLPIPAPDDPKSEYGQGRMDDAVINVTDHILISDLDVRISLTHTNVFDLQIFLQGPVGTKICLNMYDFKKEFFKGQDYAKTIFDDDAPDSIEHAEAPFTGRFKPRAGSRLEVFDGRDAYGLWRLQIHDRWQWDTGTLDSFELMITTIPEPATVIFLTLGAGLIRLHKRRNLNYG